MAHFAKIDKSNNLVVLVIRAEQDFINSLPIEENYKWVQTSYNTHNGVHYTNGEPSADQSKALRKNYAGIGYEYDENRDAFIPPKLIPSWILNESTCAWEAPIPYPNDGQIYHWNEDAYQTDNTTGWVLTENPIEIPE
jgi:hypothetical protein